MMTKYDESNNLSTDSRAKKLNMDCLDYKLGDDSVMSLIADELNTKFVASEMK